MSQDIKRIVEELEEHKDILAEGQISEILGIDIQRKKTVKIGSSRKGYRANIMFKTNGLKMRKSFWIKEVDHDCVEAINMFKGDAKHKASYRKLDFMVKPYLFIKSDHCLVMDYIKGRNLLIEFLVSSMFRNLSRIKYISEKCGTMLGHYHEMMRCDSIALEKYTNEILPVLDKNSRFGASEKGRIKKQLLNIKKTDLRIPCCRPYNDFNLRNMVIDRDNITLLDIDAMNHPKFPAYDIIYYDIVGFLINIQSQLKYWPMVNKNIIRFSQQHFLSGYQKSVSINIFNHYDELYYATLLRWYLGLKERPLVDLYPGIRNRQFVREIRKYLTSPKPLSMEMGLYVRY